MTTKTGLCKLPKRPQSILRRPQLLREGSKRKYLLPRTIVRTWAEAVNNAPEREPKARSGESCVSCGCRSPMIVAGKRRKQYRRRVPGHRARAATRVLTRLELSPP